VTVWPQVKLGDVLRRVERYEERREEVDYPFAGTYSFARGLFDAGSRSGASFKLPRVQRIHTDDFVYCKIMAWEGAFGTVPDALDGHVLSGAFVAYEVDRDRLDPKYLDWYFRLPDVWRSVGSASTGTNIRRQSLHPRIFERHEMPLPPIVKQRRVVRGLNRFAQVMSRIEPLRDRADADLKALRRVLYSEAEKVACRTAEMVQLSQIVRSHDSGWSPQCEEYPAPPDSWGVLKTTCVQWDGFRSDANKALRPELVPRPELAVHAGDILITRAGPVNRVGVACAVPADYPLLMLSDKIVRLIVSPDVDPSFVVAMLGAPTAQEYLRQSKTGLAASQVNISRSRLLDLIVPLPPLDVQRRVAASLLRALSALDTCATRRELSARSTDALRRSALRLAFD